MRRPEVSTLMSAIFAATAQGPNTCAYTLAQLFQPLLTMAISAQFRALHPSGQTEPPLPASELGALDRVMDENDKQSGAPEVFDWKNGDGKKRKTGRLPSTGTSLAEEGGKRPVARESRRRKVSSKLLGYVNSEFV